MGKYLKKFETHTQYEAFTATTEFIKPNISICIDTPSEVHYNPYECQETSVYEIVGTPSYPSEIEGDITSFDISFIYEKTDTNKKCQQTATTGTDIVTVNCGTNPSTSANRTVSGTVDYHGASISYSLTQKKGKPIIDGHEYVDLGLPSGTKWAKMNVGADSETAYGNYYRYGKGSEVYSTSQSNYSGTESPLSSYADTATQVMGRHWHMPTHDQFEELINNTTKSWETNFNGSGIKGYKFTSQNNNNYVFFPAAGYCGGSNIPSEVNIRGSYWSSTPNYGNYVFNLKLNYSENRVTYEYRSSGLSVRGVVG